MPVEIRATMRDDGDSDSGTGRVIVGVGMVVVVREVVSWRRFSAAAPTAASTRFDAAEALCDAVEARRIASREA